MGDGHELHEYFEVGVLPAYGLFARNVRGLTLQNVRFEVAKPDVRPAVVFDHVSDVAVNGFAAHANASAESWLRFIATQDVLMAAACVLTPAGKALDFASGAAAGAVKWRA